MKLGGGGGRKRQYRGGGRRSSTGKATGRATNRGAGKNGETARREDRDEAVDVNSDYSASPDRAEDRSAVNLKTQENREPHWKSATEVSEDSEEPQVGKREIYSGGGGAVVRQGFSTKTELFIQNADSSKDAEILEGPRLLSIEKTAPLIEKLLLEETTVPKVATAAEASSPPEHGAAEVNENGDTSGLDLMILRRGLKLNREAVQAINHMQSPEKQSDEKRPEGEEVKKVDKEELSEEELERRRLENRSNRLFLQAIFNSVG